MKKFGCAFILVLCIAFIGNAGFAMELGDFAPSLKISKWVKGKPVDLIKDRKKTVSILVFWSTSCPHCREAMVLLDKLQKTYKDRDVIFIGITDDDPDEVMEFITKHEGEISFTIALDDNGGSDELYMEGFDADGVPHAFIVNQDGRIAWEGHPLDEMEMVLEEIMAGEYDLQGKRMTARAKRLATVYIYMATRTREYDITGIIGDRAYQYGKKDAEFLQWFARMIITDKNKPDLALAYKVIKQAYQVSGHKKGSVLKTYSRILRKMGKDKEAEVFRRKALKAKKAENPDLNRPKK